MESISEIFAFMFLDEEVLPYGNVQMWPGEQNLFKKKKKLKKPH